MMHKSGIYTHRVFAYYNWQLFHSGSEKTGVPGSSSLEDSFSRGTEGRKMEM